MARLQAFITVALDAQSESSFPPLRNVEFGRRKTVPLIKCNGVFHMRLYSRFDSVNFFL